MSVFSKTNHSRFKDSLIKEARGLELLSNTFSANQIPYIKIPAVHAVSENKIKIDKVNCCAATEVHMQRLGQGLALLHQLPQPDFGLAEDNYIGLSPQPNVLCDNWGEFFVQFRLDFQVGLISNAQLQKRFKAILDGHKDTLAQYLNQWCDTASLVHGDLWSGNVLFDSSNVWLIDPAVYYGDRETDLAMTEMFGGFSAGFYAAYNEVYPISAAYSNKKIIYNLYHYLNHYNLFGAAYLPACEKGFRVLQTL